MFDMSEQPAKSESVKDPKINPDGSVGTSAELAPLVASYEADRKAEAVRERESIIGEPVMSSAIGSEHIHLGGADEVSDEAAVEQAEQQMKMSMQAFFEASQAEADQAQQNGIDLKKAE